MTRKPSLVAWQAMIVGMLIFSSLGFAQHSSPDLDPKLAQYVKLASELTSRARANVYFTNPQDIFRGVQFNFVNVGLGNLTFLRRDLVASGRLPRFGYIDAGDGGKVRLGTTGVYYRRTLASGDSFKADGFLSRSLFDLYSNFTFFLNDPVKGDGIQQHDSRYQEGFNTHFLQARK